jgi:hypothetical protein
MTRGGEGERILREASKIGAYVDRVRTEKVAEGDVEREPRQMKSGKPRLCLSYSTDSN